MAKKNHGFQLPKDSTKYREFFAHLREKEVASNLTLENCELIVVFGAEVLRQSQDPALQFEVLETFVEIATLHAYLTLGSVYFDPNISQERKPQIWDAMERIVRKAFG